MIVARSDYPVNREIIEKIAQFCDVEKRAVIPMITASTLYEVPLLLEQAGVGEIILEKLGTTGSPYSRLEDWKRLVDQVHKIETQNQNCFDR